MINPAIAALLRTNRLRASAQGLRPRTSSCDRRAASDCILRSSMTMAQYRIFGSIHA